MKTHDPAYKTLYAHPELVADLIRGFVHEPWVEEIDFTTLERVNASYVSPDWQERTGDLVWKVRLRQTTLYVCLLFEFQSQPDAWMAARMLVYAGLLYQDLLTHRNFNVPGGGARVVKKYRWPIDNASG
jgi:predicted transposase YdaD